MKIIVIFIFVILSTPIIAQGTSEQLIYNSQAKAILKQRFENGYIAGTGFSDDISKTINDAIDFSQNPGEFRPILGEASYVPSGGQTLHTSALYAYAIDDISLANIVINEILAIVNANDLYTTFWNESNTLRWDTDNALWIQTAKVKKLKDSYYFIKDLQTALDENDKTIIENWFSRYKELAEDPVRTRLANLMGSTWETTGPTTINNALYPTFNGASTPTPVYDEFGNVIEDYTIVIGQDTFNNRQWDAIGYIHSWAIYNDDIDSETWTREFFKNAIKYGLFPDGSWCELFRNRDSDPTLGVFYGYIALGGMVAMAHLDAIANNFPSDRLYDYETTEGLEHGSTTLTTTGYLGGSTTDGVTNKSLFTFLKGQSNYLRSSSDGGWNDIRFFKSTDDIITPLSTVGLRQPSVIPAMANIYYNNQELLDWYNYETTVGYPSKVSISEGYLAGGIGNEDMGPWGNMILGAAWYDQEDSFNASTLSIPTNNASSSLKIYPNPAQQELNISHHNFIMDQNSKLTIYDMSLRAVLTQNGAVSRIDISHLPSGFYQISVNNGLEIKNGRFIKN
ncbi:T9SS type A sorting domain-containing protein [Winogradskyella eckloniae]|uniref:T9SS type A sorting domain-containing protein n=1 Tax=Winogradskyella eckloniae TaxID=1089306 RepID=UPI001564B9C5|nr:T9SS type A sorting domain-containing protein [Winogradskyella eckloniae]NRD19964.1 T9SS type A sorting domain-containing protein [Winogradskyella eckloniae]